MDRDKWTTYRHFTNMYNDVIKEIYEEIESNTNVVMSLIIK